MELGEISSLLKGSPFSKHAKEIAEVFDRLRIKTLDDLDNAPRVLGSNLYGYSAYQIINHVRAAAIDRAIQDTPLTAEEAPAAESEETEEEAEE